MKYSDKTTIKRDLEQLKFLLCKIIDGLCAGMVGESDPPNPLIKNPVKESGKYLCPKCNAPMKLRHGSRGEFYGCSTFPTCNGTRDTTGASTCGKLKQSNLLPKSSSIDDPDDEGGPPF